MRVKVKGKIGAISSIKKANGILIPAIETFLMRKEVGTDRNHQWNSPSSVGNCARQVYFQRMGFTPDVTYNEPRLQRIFDNGTYTHIRLQEYLLGNGVLLDDEAPLFNVPYKIMGTTDGLLLDGDTIAVLEIKSINSNGFKNLVDAKDEHKMQAGIYLYCLNELRKELLRGNREQLEKEYYAKLDSFLEGGSKFTKEEKINMQMESFKKTLDWLEKYPKPITRVYFLYENKDTQELKEFCVERDEKSIQIALEKFESLNNFVENEELPLEERDTYKCASCKFKKRCQSARGV